MAHRVRMCMSQCGLCQRPSFGVEASPRSAAPARPVAWRAVPGARLRTGPVALSGARYKSMSATTHSITQCCAFVHTQCAPLCACVCDTVVLHICMGPCSNSPQLTVFRFCRLSSCHARDSVFGCHSLRADRCRHMRPGCRAESAPALGRARPPRPQQM